MRILLSLDEIAAKVINMNLVTRNHPKVKIFIEHARVLYPHLLESIISNGGVFCELLNEPIVPENQIFELRKVRSGELCDWPKSFIEEPLERAAFDAMIELSKDSYPAPIANFRICRDETSNDKAYICDVLGQRSKSHPVGYFCPPSLATLRYRCLAEGCHSLIKRRTRFLKEEFYRYCLQ